MNEPRKGQLLYRHPINTSGCIKYIRVPTCELVLSTTNDYVLTMKIVQLSQLSVAYEQNNKKKIDNRFHKFGLFSSTEILFLFSVFQIIDVLH